MLMVPIGFTFYFSFSGEILAKQMVEVKVIASPGRDKQKDELRHNAVSFSCHGYRMT